MIGVDRPPTGCFHTTFSSSLLQLEIKPFSRDVPSRSGPRKLGHSLPFNAGSVFFEESSPFEKAELINIPDKKNKHEDTKSAKVLKE